jgi:hypothetical protein
LQYHGQAAGQVAFFTDDPTAIRSLLPDHIVRAKGGSGTFAEIRAARVV